MDKESWVTKIVQNVIMFLFAVCLDSQVAVRPITGKVCGHSSKSNTYTGVVHGKACIQKWTPENVHYNELDNVLKPIDIILGFNT